MPGTGAYLVIGAIAAVVTFVTTPIVGRVARRMGWVVEPDERRVHTVATPDVGGIAMFIGFVAAFGAARLMDTFDPLFAQFTEPRGVLFAATVIFVVGFIDDVREISAPAKVMGTIVAGVVLVWYGVTMFYFRVPFLDVYILSDDWVPLITVIWLLGMTNAINLIDGLDGLAAGIVAIGAGAFFLYSQRLGDIPGMITQPNIGSLVAILTVGICIGFLPHNFNPARIFMGDGGALLLGLLLAVSTSVVGGRADPTNPLFAIVRRAARRQGVASADKGHLHHRLMEMGHGQRRSVLILWAWTALLSAFVLYPVFSGSGVSYIPIGAAMLGLVLYTILHPQIRRRRS